MPAPGSKPTEDSPTPASFFDSLRQYVVITIIAILAIGVLYAARGCLARNKAERARIDSIRSVADALYAFAADHDSLLPDLRRPAHLQALLAHHPSGLAHGGAAREFQLLLDLDLLPSPEALFDAAIKGQLEPQPKKSPLLQPTAVAFAYTRGLAHPHPPDLPSVPLLATRSYHIDPAGLPRWPALALGPVVLLTDLSARPTPVDRDGQPSDRAIAQAYRDLLSLPPADLPAEILQP